MTDSPRPWLRIVLPTESGQSKTADQGRVLAWVGPSSTPPCALAWGHDRTTSLGGVLRARRAGLRPQTSAWRATAWQGHRLRREESLSWRGERGLLHPPGTGAERHPSAQLLDALGRALRLDPTPHALHQLAGDTAEHIHSPTTTTGSVPSFAS